MHPRWLALTLFTCACTTLGPMPATTGMSAVPTGRPSVELQAAMTPVYFLSDTVRTGPADGIASPQLAALIEPDRWFKTKGLVLGARSWGEGGDRPFEPMVGMRRKLDDRFAVAGFAYGTHVRGAASGASYQATRLGGEVALDANVGNATSWLALHVQASVSATYLDATGEYCATSDGLAIDCDDGSRRVDAAASGVYAAGTAGVSLDIARRPHGSLHAVRLALLGAVGGMPRIRDGVQQSSTDRYTSIGLSLTLAFGEAQ